MQKKARITRQLVKSILKKVLRDYFRSVFFLDLYVHIAFSRQHGIVSSNRILPRSSDPLAVLLDTDL
jgi:hypothetical protein